MINRIKRLLALSMALLLLTGCWDKIEINELAFVIALGIDMEEDGRYTVTCVIPNLPVYTGKEGGAQDEAKYTKTASASTITGAYKELTTRLNKELNFEHMEALVLGDSLFQDPDKLKQLANHVDRNAQYSKKIPVLAAKGKAADVLEAPTTDANAVGQYISGIYENNASSIIRHFEVSLQEFISKMSGEEINFLLPVILLEEEEISIENAMVLKDGRNSGIMELKDMERYSWLRNFTTGLEYPLSLSHGVVSMEIEESKCKYGYAMDAEGRLTISLSIEAYAKIGEYAFDRGDDLAEESIRNEIERLASEQIKSDVTTMLAAMQTVYQADICGLNEDMKFQNKKLYLETQDIWQDVFANANFAVDAEVTVRRIGITK